MPHGAMSRFPGGEQIPSTNLAKSLYVLVQEFPVQIPPVEMRNTLLRRTEDKDACVVHLLSLFYRNNTAL